MAPPPPHPGRSGNLTESLVFALLLTIITMRMYQGGHLASLSTKERGHRSAMYRRYTRGGAPGEAAAARGARRGRGNRTRAHSPDELIKAVRDLELAHGVGIGRGNVALAVRRVGTLKGPRNQTYADGQDGAGAYAAQTSTSAPLDASQLDEALGEEDEATAALRKKKERDREERIRERKSEELQKKQSAKESDVFLGDLKVNGNELGASWDLLDHLKVVDEATPLVTHKRQFVYFNETLQRTMLRHYLEYTDANSSYIYHFPRDLFDLLPLDEPQFAYDSCAIVGNSGVVLLNENGEEIDAHDAIIRVNVAPVRGFEAFVGRRTTFDIVNAHNVKELLMGIRKWRTDSTDSHLVMFETASHFSRYRLCYPVLRKLAHANPLLLNPAFSNIAHRTWVQLKFLLESERNSMYNRKPMSGFFAAFFAMQVCKQTTLYGFDAYTSRRRNYRYHYFDNVQGFTDVHSFDLAMEVFRLIEKHDRGRLLRIQT